MREFNKINVALKNQKARTDQESHEIGLGKSKTQ